MQIRHLRTIPLLTLWALILGIDAGANSAPTAPAAPSGPSIYQFVVNVDVQKASIFGFGGGGGNGTGWVYQIFERDGERFAWIVTNNHVIKTEQWVARRITIEVKEGQFPEPDRALARVIYESPYDDIAVLELKLTDLERSANFLVPAPLPPRDHPLFNYEANADAFVGRRALAAGNPLGGRSISTFGEISGSRMLPQNGVLIQTQAPINPGNSGGPLIDVAEGVVIGMNTLKLNNADNVGLAIPIRTVIRDIERWVARPQTAYRPEFPAKIAIMSREQLELLGYDSLIRAQHPDYFRYVNAAVLVEDAPEIANGFRAGDVIISLNGRYIGMQIFRIGPMLAEADQANFEVIRQGRLIRLSQAYIHNGHAVLRRRANFLILSGIIFQEASPLESFLTVGHLNHPVRIGGVIPNQERRMAGLGTPGPHSVVVGIELNNEYHSISSLDQLKDLIRSRPEGVNFVRIDLRETVKFSGPNGQTGVVISDGVPVIGGTTTTYMLPINEVITPGNIGLNAFTRRFQIGGPIGTETNRRRDWRANLRPITWIHACEHIAGGGDISAAAH